MSAAIKIVQGDITKLKVDAIVNAANASLMGGGGVDGAIHRAGGPAIREACAKIRQEQGGCPTGEAVITTAGNLPARFVIHTVGPIWHGGDQQEPLLLANCYRYSLLMAVRNNVVTIAFPNISTGVYGFPKKKAAAIALTEIKKFITHNETVKEIIFCCFDEENYDIYKQLMASEDLQKH